VEARSDTGATRFLGVLIVFVVGVVLAWYWHGAAFRSSGIYKEDVLQSPHWAAYHTTTFQPDDPIVEYASFNESPLQNAIYWTLTWFVDFVLLGKALAILSYGLLAVLFYLAGREMYGERCGLLLALFILAFPQQFDYSAGFFSKYWAIPLIMVCIWLLESGRFKGLIALLPFGALAYPTVAVMIGMIAAVYLGMEWFRERERALRLFKMLAIGSLLAVTLLMVKYASPPDDIGAMRPSAELREMPELRSGGYPSQYIPIPSVDEALVDQVDHPFVLLNVAIFFLVLGRGVAWERSWTALLIASVLGYVLADLLFMKLYIPNRYTRYSLAVLLALWSARNWDLILARIRSQAAAALITVALCLVGAYLYRDSYGEIGNKADRTPMVPVARVIREQLPAGVLIAGSPPRLDDVMIQARRSVLVPFKLAHPWFTDYYEAIRERTRATLRAHYADGPEPLNELHRKYGVTHFLVEKVQFRRAARGEPIFAQPYNDEIYEYLGPRRGFYLSNPPVEHVVWESDNYAILELPIDEAGR
jgi:hypothetical protein